jgi:hypothetical protein
MIEILTKHISANTQIHNGKCWFLGMTTAQSHKGNAYDIESGGTIGAGNQIAWTDDGFINDMMLPLPGIKCSNGLYMGNGSTETQVYYYI